MININLIGYFEKMIAEKLASGRYGSPSEVVAEALRLLDYRDGAAQDGDKAPDEVAMNVETRNRNRIKQRQVRSPPRWVGGRPSAMQRNLPFTTCKISAGRVDISYL